MIELQVEANIEQNMIDSLLYHDFDPGKGFIVPVDPQVFGQCGPKTKGELSYCSRYPKRFVDVIQLEMLSLIAINQALSGPFI